MLEVVYEISSSLGFIRDNSFFFRGPLIAGFGPQQTSEGPPIKV